MEPSLIIQVTLLVISEFILCVMLLVLLIILWVKKLDKELGAEYDDQCDYTKYSDSAEDLESNDELAGMKKKKSTKKKSKKKKY